MQAVYAAYTKRINSICAPLICRRMAAWEVGRWKEGGKEYKHKEIWGKLYGGLARDSALCGRNDDKSQNIKRAQLVGQEGEISLDLLIRCGLVSMATAIGGDSK